jgi:DNA sulfur modification protein DndB
MTNSRVVFDRTFAYSFPAIRGIQAGREYYVAMCPMKVIPKIFQFNESCLPPEIRAQRTLNEVRIPEIARYMLQNPDSYVFSALTASIDADTHFDPLDSAHGDNGLLFVSMDGDFLINDGQHRRAAIELALREDPDLGDETIAVVFFIDRGIQKAQQMFTDLNKHAVQPSPSLNVLYDHRDPKARVIREVVLSSAFYKDLVEMEKSNLVARSRKLFTLSALHSATSALLADLDKMDLDENIRIAREFWDVVAQQFNEWHLVREGLVAASEVRQNYLHSHGVILHAIGKCGNALLLQHAETWKEEIPKLKTIDWSRSNSAWEGRAVIMGKAKKSRENIILTCNCIKQAFGLSLSTEEQEVENTFLKKRS